MTYELVVKNDGNIDASIDDLTTNYTNNEAFTFTTTGIAEGDTIAAGASKTITVVAKYNDVTNQPSSTSSTYTLSLKSNLPFCTLEERITSKPYS